MYTCLCLVLKEEKQDEVEQVSVYSVVEEDTEKCSEQFGSKPPEESLFSDDDFSPPELSREQIDVLLKVSCIVQIPTLFCK